MAICNDRVGSIIFIVMGSHNKYKVHIVIHITLLQYPSVEVFVHSFNFRI